MARFKRNSEKALDPILSGDRDVLISASTAAGKTEAFFLPACSKIADIQNGFGILYISPLKALINDQFRRLESLGEELKLSITPWHGDSSQGRKNSVKKSFRYLTNNTRITRVFAYQRGWLA
jgi:ATP-dependent Lhr-like helicase